MTTNEWTTSELALAYLARADSLPHRTEGEAVLLEHVPLTTRRILDLGTGDGRLLALLKLDRPSASGVALDFPPRCSRQHESGSLRIPAWRFWSTILLSL